MACGVRTHPGDDLMKDFETGWWIHASCLARERHAVLGITPEHAQKIQHWRDEIVDAVRCPRCGSTVGAMCRELGKERLAVHRQRITAWERSATVVTRVVA